MPVLTSSSYRAPSWLLGGHLQTIIPSLFRRQKRLTHERERLELADGDFLDLEWNRQGRERLAIFCHGLEADAGASYVQEVAAVLSANGWDLLAWNYRGCGAELNRLPRFYHSGATEDLAAVLTHAIETHPATQIDLIGFSLGGNLILKYLGEGGEELSPRLGRAVTFSVPCDLACSSAALDNALNRVLYMRRFIKSMKKKIERKAVLFPEAMDPAGLAKIRTFREFDDRYTAPLHGFRDAEDYWRRSSARPSLANIRVPSLLVNARNDPFLGPRCYPEEEASKSAAFFLEVPPEGGHVGFWGKRSGRDGSWMAERALQFLSTEH